MKAVICELCGSNQLIKKDGFFQCEYCGMKYTLEEVRKLSANIYFDGKVQISASDFIVRAGTLKKYNGESAIVIIPDSVNVIAPKCFKGQSIEKVHIPNSVTNIGDHAFEGCTRLTSITIPDSVTTIGEYAFEGCTSLKSVTLPNSITNIETGTFARCTGLKSITIPESVTSIGNATFSDCTGLKSITIPNSVTIIGGCTFDSCTGLTSITIPESVTSIGYRAFSRCTGLTSITIPDSVKEISSLAFEISTLDPEKTQCSIYSNDIFHKCFIEQGYCVYCAGKIKKGIFSTGYKCSRCGHKYTD